MRFKGSKGCSGDKAVSGYGKFPREVPAMTTPRSATVLVNPAARGVSERFDGSRIVRYLGAAVSRRA